MKTKFKIPGLKFSRTILIIAIISSNLFPNNAVCQQLLTYEQNIPIDPGKKKKIIKDLNEWILSRDNLILKNNIENESYVLEGNFVFENQVKYESSSTISRMYTSQTNGKIEFEFKIFVRDNHLVFNIGNFKHIPNSKGDKIDFGYLTVSDNAPDNLKHDYNADWFDKVWLNMKKIAEENSLILMKQIPSKLISNH